MHVIQLLSFNINNTDFYFTDAGAHYTYQQTQYLAGFWQGLAAFEQRIAPAINEQAIQLIDADLSLTIFSYAGQWQWRPLTVRWLVVDDQGHIEDDFMILQSAIIMHESRETDQGRELTFRVQENHTLELVTGHRTNVASQHLIDPTDNGFELLPFLDGIKLPWGKEGNGIVLGSNQSNQSDQGYHRIPRYEAPNIEVE